MNRRLYFVPIALALALGACATQSSPQLTSAEADTEEVVALSEATVDAAIEVANLEADALAEPMPSELLEGTEPVIGARYELRRGETLAHFARWSELPVEDIADASDLSLHEFLAVGTRVIVPVTGEDQVALERRRNTHRTERVESYLASRGGSAFTDFHQVRTGETAWSISKDAGALPVWVLESYNPSVDLERLRPGQQLLVPVIADMVVDSGSDEVELVTDIAAEPLEILLEVSSDSPVDLLVDEDLD